MAGAALIASDALSNTEKVVWKEAFYHSVNRTLFIGKETDRVCAALAAARIRYAKLKGSVLAGCYPKYGMREMSDIDMLIDPAMTEQARDVMLSLGYEVTEYGISHHDTYIKQPFYCFELHNKLFMDVYRDYHSYFLNCFDRLIDTPDSTYEKKFSDDDFYLFQLAHTCKHLHKSGIGLRVLTDIYVIHRHFDLHREILAPELEKLGISDDARLLSSLAEKLFADTARADIPPLTQEEENLLSFMLNSGIRGTFEHLLINRSSQDPFSGDQDMTKNRNRYIMRRLFPDPESYRKSHPFFYRHKIARPILPFVRLTASAAKRKGKIRREIKNLYRISKKEEK